MKLKSKLGLTALNGVIIFICFLSTIGTTYFIVDSIKNQEITDLKTKYDTEISNLNASISNYANEIDTLTVNLSTANLSIDRYKFIGTWQYVDSTSKISFYPSGKIFDYSGVVVSIDWRIEDGKLVEDRHYYDFMLDFNQGYHIISYYNYSFSENDTALILTLTELPNVLIPNGFTSVLVKQC
jgi:hypothetical protein